MSAEPILEVRGLAVDFATEGGWQRVVEGVDLELARGEVLGIVGESGSGKTVTSRALIRLLPKRGCRIAGGEVVFEGRDLLGLPEDALQQVRGSRIAMIFQNPMTHLDPVMRIGRQIAVGLMLHRGMDSRAARKRAIELLAEVGFREPERQVDAFPHELSGGMKQRAMIAGALSCDPAVLIADEPTTALDVTVQAQIIGLLRDLRRQHSLSIVFISHDLGLVADFCDRVAVMERGRIVETAAVGEVIERPQPSLHCQPAALSADHGRARQLLSAERTAGRSPAAAQPGWRGRDLSHHRRPGRQLQPEARASRPSLMREPAGAFAAVDGVSLTLRRGEALGLVGESGSGKSTLARSVVGLAKPDRGRISLNGQVLEEMNESDRAAWRRRVQMIFQDPLSSLNPKMTVADTLAEPLKVHAICPPDQVAQTVQALMAEVGLEPGLADRRPHQLSGGQCQRVGIARALAVKPELLLADEPTSALDVTIQAQILNLLMSLRQTRGLTMIFISHDLTVVRHLCQTVAVMQQGQLVETGSVEEIFQKPKQPYTSRLLAAIPRAKHQ